MGVGSSPRWEHPPRARVCGGCCGNGASVQFKWLRRLDERQQAGLRGQRAGAVHRLVQADCLQWLHTAVMEKRHWGLIFLDPPSFSASKRMSETFDVQRDHVKLIRDILRLLEPDGILIFSNNLRRFRMDREALPGMNIEEMTARTLPQDFARNPRIHNCWKIRRDPV